MKKTLLLLAVALLVNAMSVKAQSAAAATVAEVSFALQSDGSFKNSLTGNTFAVVECPGISQHQLFYAFLVTLQNKCVRSTAQYTTVEDRCINVFSYESPFSNWNAWTGGFNGYLYYKFMFQFKDGKVRIEAPIVDHLGYPNKTESYMRFEAVLHGPNRLFNADGTIVQKRAEIVNNLNLDLNSTLNSIIHTALRVDNW